LFANGEGDDEKRRLPSAGRLFVTKNKISKNEIPFCFSVTLEERTIVLEGFFNKNRYSFQFSDGNDLPMSQEDQQSEVAFGDFQSIVLREGIIETDIKDTSIYELKAFGTEKGSNKALPMIIYIHFEMLNTSTKKLEKVTLICEIFEDTNTAKVRLVSFRPIYRSKVLAEKVLGKGEECKREEKKRISIRSMPNPRRRKDSDSDSETVFAKGMRVKVFGLVNDPEFNGLKGTIYRDLGDESFDVNIVVNGVMKTETFDQMNLKVVKRKKSKSRPKEQENETKEEREERLKEKKQRTKKRNDLIYDWENKETNGHQFNQEDTEFMERYERREAKRVKKEELKAAANAAANAQGIKNRDAKNKADFEKLYARLGVLKMNQVSNDIIQDLKDQMPADQDSGNEDENVVVVDLTNLNQDKIYQLLTHMREEIEKKEKNMLRKFNKMYARIKLLKSDTLRDEIKKSFEQNGGFDDEGHPHFSKLSDSQKVTLLRIFKQKLEKIEEDEQDEQNAVEVSKLLKAKSKGKKKNRETETEADNFSDDEDYVRHNGRK
jgi:hypothetical protein